MPKLNEYISVGFCMGYGDGDYRVTSSVANLSKKEMDELVVTTIGALECARDMWRRRQAENSPPAAMPKVAES